MRLSLSALLPLFCATASCFGGPTSDWPGKNHGDDGPGQNSDDSPPKSEGATPTGGGKDGTASGPSASFDASVIAIPATDGDDAADAGVPDGGLVDGGALLDGGALFDGGTVDAHVFDGGVLACSVDSDALTAGSCYGVYCATTPEQLQRNLSVAGQCRDAVDLALACNGELTRVVASCAQDDVLTLGLGSSVAECARAEPSLQNASDGCIDCYVSELLCAVQSCLTPCLAGLSPSCTECRSAHCGKAFQACTGLPAP